MIKKKKSIIIALIHNNDVKRNAYIRPLLEKLQDFISGNFDIKFIEIAYQPEIKPHIRLIAFLRDIMIQKLNRDWLRYRLLKPPFLLRHIASFFKSVLKTKRYVHGSSWLHSSAVETVVTDKHIRAWEFFLDTGADFLICFEDDLVFKDDSIQRVLGLLDLISESNENKLIYIDLAGGFQTDNLKIDKLESHRDNSFKYYSKPVTNTVCGYLLSRSLTSRFHEILLRRPWLRLIGADWMVNKLFILLNKSGTDCLCMHSEPTIFKQGSMIGEYFSMLRIRQ